MRDVHCHILPGVDDGARDMRESVAMLAAAKSCGIDKIVATPHCRGSHFSMKHVVEAHSALCKESPGIPITLAFEVYYKKLVEIGIEHAPRLRNPETDEFLLELPTGELPIDFERTLFQLQGQGLKVIIAHPERYAFVQEDIDVAEDWVERGCALQVSADFMGGGLLSKSKRTAQKLIAQGMVRYIASDAHSTADYQMYRACIGKYGKAPRHR